MDDTVVEIEYVEFIEYVTEYIDCDTGMPCSSNINELINNSKKNSDILILTFKPNFSYSLC